MTREDSPPAPGFAAIGVDPAFVTALEALGYEEPTAIQRESIPPLLEGRDLLGQAATGTGKTAAFALPILQRVVTGDPEPNRPRALVLVPTRELAMQVAEALHRYGRAKHASVLPIYGGQHIGQQLRALQRGAEVVVATPGRALDHIERGTLDLQAVRIVVLDEADEMLDLGFIEDVERILRMCPSGRQTALFSATIPEPVARLAQTYMYEPVTIRVTPKQLTVDSVEQAYVMVEPRKKQERLVEVLRAEEPEQAIIFCRTKIGAARLGKQLDDKGLHVRALHGDLTQGQRDGVMISFKEHKVPLLVATDIAARGLDIEHVTHVINYDLPNNPEIYVHRIGRTGRVGRTGRAITFATAKQAGDLKTIERVVKVPIEEWEPPEERIEHAPRPRHREAPPKAPADGTVKLFCSRGRRSGIEEEDLRFALEEGAVIDSAAIREIRVLDRFSFVQLDAPAAERAIEMLNGTRLKGHEIRFEPARS
jgi:ATP-dependent RNA helicase DeaD